MSSPNCSVPGCSNPAAFKVLLCDVYLEPEGGFFSEQDFTCPYLCEAHRDENEQKADGTKLPRGVTLYPFTNQHAAQGYTDYEALPE